MLNEFKSVENRENIRIKNKEYKRELIKAQRAHRKKFNSELRKIKVKNPKLCCDMLADNNKDKLEWNVCPIERLLMSTSKAWRIVNPKGMI